MNKLYALLDYDLLQKYQITIDDFINKCYELDAKIIQYRDKHSPIDQIKQRLVQIRQKWKRDLIINDYVELVMYANGVHLGQEDLDKYNSVDELRQIVGDDKIIGISVHNMDELSRVNHTPIDYIGLGAYRPTSTKDVTEIHGDKLLDLAKISLHDTAIIGGVRLDDEFKYATYKVVGSAICEAIKQGGN
ncbi:MAG: thiamine phosphate synthase [Epsilonproteobacteria bacterium]|nr:thiamine phosphate synthase [Campylobacterota bacterium]